MRASAPLAAAGSLTRSSRPPNAGVSPGGADAAAKEAERKAALSPLERLAEFGQDITTSDGPAAVADKQLTEVGVEAWPEALATGYPNRRAGARAGYCTGFAAKKVGPVGFAVVGSANSARASPWTTPSPRKFTRGVRCEQGRGGST